MLFEWLPALAAAMFLAIGVLIVRTLQRLTAPTLQKDRRSKPSAARQDIVEKTTEGKATDASPNLMHALALAQESVRHDVSDLKRSLNGILVAIEEQSTVIARIDEAVQKWSPHFANDPWTTMFDVSGGATTALYGGSLGTSLTNIRGVGGYLRNITASAEGRSVHQDLEASGTIYFVDSSSSPDRSEVVTKLRFGSHESKGEPGEGTEPRIRRSGAR